MIGVNGVGKSTLLRTLSGIQPPLSGDFYIDNKKPSQLSSRELATKISLVLTNQPFSRNLRAAELVALGRQPYTDWLGGLSQLDKEKTAEALERVEISHLKKSRCFELSDGQLQKVLIARALAQDTPLMILDEPTSHLDIYHKAQVLKLLQNLSKQTGKAILFASHEINLALQLCDRIILMKKDAVLQGSPRELIAAGAFESIFPPGLISFDPASLGFRLS